MDRAEVLLWGSCGVAHLCGRNFMGAERIDIILGFTRMTKTVQSFISMAQQLNKNISLLRQQNN
jgi:hypothetical protein